MPENRDFRPRTQDFIHLSILLEQVRDGLRLLSGIDTGLQSVNREFTYTARMMDNLLQQFDSLTSENLQEFSQMLNNVLRNLRNTGQELGQILSEYQSFIESLQGLANIELPEPVFQERISEIVRGLSPQTREVIGTPVIEQLARSRTFRDIRNVLELMNQRGESLQRALSIITSSVQNLSTITPELLQQAVQSIDRMTGPTGRRAMSSLLSRVVQGVVAEAGLGRLSQSVSTIVSDFKSFGARWGTLFLAVEAILEIYRFVQSVYTDMRKTLLPQVTYPGASPMFWAERLGLSGQQLGRFLMGIANEFRAQMNQAYYDIRISQEDYLRILGTLREKGIGVEATFDGIRITGEAASGQYRRLLGVMDEYVRRLYVLSYATGLSVDALVNGAYNIMKVTDERNFYRALDTFVALNEIATRLHISGQQFTSWVTSTANNLRLFGYSVVSSTQAISRHTRTLWSGVVSIQELINSVRQFLGQSEQLMGIGFFGALQNRGPLGEFLRQIVESSGIAEAYATYRLLISNSVETIQRAAQTQGFIGQAAQNLIERAGSSLGELIQQARLSQVVTPQQLVGGIGGQSLQYFLQQQLLGETVLPNNLLQASERFQFSMDMLNSRVERINSQLQPITRYGEQITDITEGLLSDMKSIRQLLASVEGTLRRIAGWLFENVSGPPSAVTPPRMR